jgi:hypothetical protein
VIRFTCPTCHHVYTVADDAAGLKTACGACGQRLQVPTPPRPLPTPVNRTVLGTLAEPVPVEAVLEPEAVEVVPIPQPPPLPPIVVQIPVSPPPVPTAPPQKPWATSLGILGAIVFLLALWGVIHYWNMDTTVASTDFNGQPIRIHNIGLMSERQNGLILSLVFFAIGTGMVIAGSRH